MTTDAWLAIAHHLAIFGVFAVLVAEWAIVTPGLRAEDVRRVGRIDLAYGALAGAVVAAGVSRVVWGAKPADFYTENPVFWFKMAAFATVGLLSVAPTFRYIRWVRALDEEGGGPPEAAEVVVAHKAIRLQLEVFAAIPVLAALMARGIGR
jgi:putative membrane protein